MAENSDWPFSFENICEVLGLNPEYVRQGLIRWKERKVVERPKAKVYRLNPRKGKGKPIAVVYGRTGQSSLKAAAR